MCDSNVYLLSGLFCLPLIYLTVHKFSNDSHSFYPLMHFVFQIMWVLSNPINYAWMHMSSAFIYFFLLLLIKTHFCDAKWKSNSLKNTLYLQCILLFKACGFHLTRPNMHGCICQAHHAYFFKTTIIKKVMPMGNQYTY